LALLTVIEGIDGSGKGTQAKRLHTRLLESGAKAELLSFPRYDQTVFGKAVGDFLNGRFGELNQVSPFLASLLYAGDRFESRQVIRDALANNDVVVCDRYVPSNIAHQAAKCSRKETAELVRWVQTIEYHIFELPQPDVVVLLDLPAEKAQQLIAQKAARTYTDKAADLHETDTEYLQNVRSAYQRLADHESGWSRIDCWDGDTLMSIDDVNDRIWDIMQAHRNS
jgi:dTMP kinase